MRIEHIQGLDLSVVEHEDVERVKDESDLSESVSALIPEARSNSESIVCGTWHMYRSQDA